MVYSRFRKNCVVRILLLAATTCLFTYLVLTTSRYTSMVGCGLLVVFQIFELLRFVEKAYRNLARFLQSIEHSDFSQSFSSSQDDATFAELNAAFSSVVHRYRELGLEREENYRYLQTVVQHVGIGMIAFRKDGEVELLNTAAKRLFDLPALKNIEVLGKVSPELLERLRAMAPGERELITVSVNDERLQLSVYATELRQRHKIVTLVSFQNISSEFNEKEMDAWQNLIRVLTHEIKNSLAPIASLASSTEELLLPAGAERKLTVPCDAGDVRDALQTIQRRSHGLLQFVDTYRDLTHIPRPQYKTLSVADLFDRVEKLIRSDMTQDNITWATSIMPENLTLTADPELVEQVLINLILNAVQALQGQSSAAIDLDASADERGRIAIRVTDNGPGIVKDALEKIFVPFYSTRKRGSGIGLSLSRQIMRLHRGDITVQSEPNVRTTFTMRF